MKIIHELNKAFCVHLNQIRASGVLSLYDLKIVMEFEPVMFEHMKNMLKLKTQEILKQSNDNKIKYQVVKDAYDIFESHMKGFDIEIKWNNEASKYFITGEI